MSQQFIDALENNDLATIRATPKTDLHNHLILGARVERIESWQGCTIARPPEKIAGVSGMMKYAGSALYPYINSQAGFEFTADAAIRDAMEDGVRILEISVDAKFAFLYTDQVKGLHQFLSGIRDRHQERINVRFEIGFSRGDPTERLDLAYQCIDTGFFTGIDLYGDQALITPYIELVHTAKQAGMTIKAHVGEHGPADLIKPTVEAYELDGIQHGISAVQSPELMTWLARHQIPCHVCPGCNVMLSAVDTLAGHPIKTMYEQGVCVTINSDDLMITSQSVSDQYLSLYQTGVLSAQALNRIRENGLELVGYSE